MLLKSTAPPRPVPNGRDGSPSGPIPQAHSAPPATLPPPRLRASAGNSSDISHQASVLGRKAASAFTLLEVLVASAIMGIVLFVLVSTANTSLRLWRGTSEKMAMDREGRMGHHLLAWDLKNIVQPTNINLRPWINTNIISNGSAPTNFPMLRFLTRKPADYQSSSDLGDLCYVEYRYSNYSILRAFVGSRDTFASLTNTNTGPAFPTNVPSATNFQTLATNVWRFKLWGHQSTNTNVSYNSSTGRQNLASENLAAIEYRIGVLDQKFMKLYSGPGGAAIALAQKTNGVRWYQAIQPVSSPAQ